jgi:hypothetical protein
MQGRYMPRLKPEVPAQDIIEKDFLDALDRLQSGSPRNKSLKVKQKEGLLRITVQNVALEAGRSRTLIGLEKCRYPRIRELIKQVKGGGEGPPTTHSELIQRLRVDKATLVLQIATYKAEATAHFLARLIAEKEVVKERATTAQLRKEISRKKEILHLTVVDSE